MSEGVTVQYDYQSRRVKVYPVCDFEIRRERSSVIAQRALFFLGGLFLGMSVGLFMAAPYENVPNGEPSGFMVGGAYSFMLGTIVLIIACVAAQRAMLKEIEPADAMLRAREEG